MSSDLRLLSCLQIYVAIQDMLTAFTAAGTGEKLLQHFLALSSDDTDSVRAHHRRAGVQQGGKVSVYKTSRRQNFPTCKTVCPNWC